MACVLALSRNEVTLAQKYVQLSVLILLQIFVYCWMGQNVENSWSDMTEQMYSGPWYLLRRKNLRLVKYMMIGATESVSMQIGKVAPLNFFTFSCTLRKLVSLFTVMCAALL